MSNSNPKLKEAKAKLLKVLPKRSRDVITRRFGINRKRKETLESIGHTYGITRERVRQIENEALKILRKKDSLTLIQNLLDDLEIFISEHGGLVKEKDLLEDFVIYIDPSVDKIKFRGFILLLLNLSKDFKYARENAKFHSLWYTKKKALNEASSLITELVKIFKREKAPLREADLIARLKKNFPFFSRQAIVSYINASKTIDRNIFNDLGLSKWSEINPKGIKDKAYLVVQKTHKPLHFREISEAINKANFSKRIANPQTVHNELIKDSRFVLVGRGLYALTQWGYRSGTVKDILINIFREQKENVLPEEKLIALVIQERFVKESTIRFNLKSNKEFKEVQTKHYTLLLK
jgi:DNA-directed RNA polymerase delta subunit